MTMMVYQKKPGRDCLTVGLAGLFPDLGLTRLDEEPLQKAEPLNPEEWELLKQLIQFLALV